MTFSSKKAQEIYDRMKIDGKINYWVGLAGKNHITEKAHAQPGSKWSYDGSGLREELKRHLASSVPDAQDENWDEIAEWLLDLATLAK